MQTQFFSIIVPVYNVANYLEKTIKSIQNQDFSDYECIIIDDGSTDSSSDLGEASSKPPLNVIEKFSSFKHNEESISKIYYYKKRKISKVKIFLFKMLTLIFWCNPYLFKKIKKLF